MALMDAKEYDPRPAQRRNRLIGIAIGLVVVLGIVWYLLRFYPEERTVNRFFAAIEAKNFETAYGIYLGDPDWKQHPDKHKNYTLPQFHLDWGPSSEFGAITSHHVDCAVEPPKSGFLSSTGVVVVITINKRAQASSMWVEKSSKALTYPSPREAVCR